MLSRSEGDHTRGLGVLTALSIILLGLCLHGSHLTGPFNDGQNGNCGAMFALFARNASSVDVTKTLGTPVINLIPPEEENGLIFYAHHPPGLPWLVSLTTAVGWMKSEGSARLVALFLTLLSALLLSDLTTRLGGQARGIIAGGLFLLLPAGLHHGLLVNYETIALSAVLLLTRNILLEKKSGLAVGIFAGLADYVALTPLIFTARSSSSNKSWRKACVGGFGVVLFLMVITRFQAPGSWSETLGQAVGASFLATDFSLQNWLGFGGSSLWALFGWALPLASLGIVILCRHQGNIRKILGVLILTALFNVTVFAHHATTHEHYWLFFVLPVAFSIALLPLPPLHKKYAVSNALLALLVIGLGFIQAKNEWGTWGATKQADRADAFSQVSTPDLIYLHPDGLPLVFLHRAQRHAIASEVRSLDQAKELVQSYREQVGLEGMQAALFLEQGRPVPPWLAAVAAPRRDSGPFTFWVLEKTP